MMKSVLFIVLALAVAVTAQQTFPNAACTDAPGSSAGNVDLAAPTFVAAGSSLTSTHLILNFDVDARYRSINFQFTTGSQGSQGSSSCDWSRTAAASVPADVSAWTSAYPTANTACTDKIRITSDFTAPQTALGQCFAYDNTTDPNFVFYTAIIKITTEQNRAQIRNTPIVRTVTTAVQLRFRFQRFITVNSSSLTVVGNANILSDVISQTFDTATEHTTIVLLTSVQQPYQLTLNGAEATTVSNGYTFIQSITETHSGNVGAANAPAVPQACTAGGVNNLGAVTVEGSSTPTACTQKWSVTIAAPANTCLFNAVINYGFVLNVTSDYIGSFAGITSLQGGNVYNPSYQLATNDYCAKIVDDITLSGTLTPYGTEPINPTNPGTPLFNYLFGQTVYFLAFVQASAGPSITGTNFDQATVTTVSSTVQKVVDFTTATQNGFLGFGKWNYVGQGQPQYAAFKFLIDENTVTLENFDVAQPVTVSATFRVDYQNLGNAGSSAVELASAPKFRSFAAGNQGLAMTVDVGVTRPATATGSSSLVAMVAGIAAGCVALTAFVALFLYRRSTSKFAEQVSAPVDPKELEAIENRLATTAV